MEAASYIIKKICVYLIVAYRYLLSPFLGNCCRFYPSCSVYMQTAIERFGIFKGGFLGAKRLVCCHPWHKGGYDPVPEN